MKLLLKTRASLSTDSVCSESSGVLLIVTVVESATTKLSLGMKIGRRLGGFEYISIIKSESQANFTPSRSILLSEAFEGGQQREVDLVVTRSKKSCFRRTDQKKVVVANPLGFRHCTGTLFRFRKGDFSLESLQ